MPRPMMAIMLLGAAALFVAGCMVPAAIGGMMQNAEYQKLIIVPAEYEGLSGRDVAVLVDSDMVMMYEHPRMPAQVALGLATQIQKSVPGAKVLNPEATMRWQYTTPSWNLMSYEDIARDLGVERVVIVDMYEYRLHPPGNRYEWQGIAAANVRIVEADESAFDPNLPAAEYDIIVEFPAESGIVMDGATSESIEAGLLIKFIRQIAWLFYEHEEPKYPDRYRPPPPK